VLETDKSSKVCKTSDPGGTSRAIANSRGYRWKS
jgi:hypothetical protein